MIATTTLQLYEAVGGVFLVSTAFGVIMASVIWITWLILKGRKGGAYADFSRE